MKTIILLPKNYHESKTRKFKKLYYVITGNKEVKQRTLADKRKFNKFTVLDKIQVKKQEFLATLRQKESLKSTLHHLFDLQDKKRFTKSIYNANKDIIVRLTTFDSYYRNAKALCKTIAGKFYKKPKNRYGV